jgi:hypothetical protein
MTIQIHLHYLLTIKEKTLNAQIGVAQQNLNGVKFRLSGWKRESARGEFISGQIQTKEMKTAEYGKPAVEGSEEDVPFLRRIPN